MKDELISFETAKLAKEKGFDECVLNHYYDRENSTSSASKYEMFMDDVKNSEMEPIEYSAPTQSLLQKWIRELHGINVEVKTYAFGYWVCHHNAFLDGADKRWNVNNELSFQFKTYEESLEKGLIESLKLI